MPSYGSFYNGEGVSPEDQNGFDATQNIDVHTNTGTAQCQLALVSESTTPNEDCVQATDASANTFFFSTESGKTWKRTSGGSYSLVNTNANGAHISAYYSPTLNKIVYTTSTKVGYTDSTTFTDTLGTFTNGSSYHPIEEVNLTVFIGDGKYVSSISSALAFSANALDIPSNLSITALKNERNYLLIGTIISTTVSSCMVYLWDSFSSSWTTDDEVKEPGVNAFVNGDNVTYALCGLSGRIYQWTGAAMAFYYQIRNATTSVGQHKVTALNGKPLMAIGAKIYSIFKRLGDRDVVVHEYTTTTGDIISIGTSGTQLLVSNGTGIDKIDSNYATAKITTPISSDRPSRITVPYKSLPSGTTLGLETNVNGAGWVSETGFIDDTTNSEYVLQGGVSYAGTINFIQARITLNPLLTATPVIREIML